MELTLVWGWIIFTFLFAFMGYIIYRLNKTDRKLHEHTKQRHKHYRKREKITGNLIDDTPVNEIKVGGTD
jgi:hypothetical protein